MPCHAMLLYSMPCINKRKKQRSGDVIRDGLVSGEPGSGRQAATGRQRRESPAFFFCVHSLACNRPLCELPAAASTCSGTAGSTTFGLRLHSKQQPTNRYRAVTKHPLCCQSSRMRPSRPTPAASPPLLSRELQIAMAYLAALYSIPLARLERLGPHRWPPRLHLVHALSRSRRLDLIRSLG